MAVKVGKDAKVTLGSDTIIGIGDWSIDGMTRQEFDASQFGDEDVSYEYGMREGGSISFSGNHDPTDTTGQVAIEEAHDANTDLTNLRCYIDNTSYYEPCQTTGYLSPNKTTGANTVLSHVNITSQSINYDKGSLGRTSFNARVSGRMVLV